MRVFAIWVAGVFFLGSIFSWLWTNVFRAPSRPRLTVAQQFAKELGDLHPIIFGGTLRNAALEASSTSRFVLICLHSTEMADSEGALSCLSNENVNNFVNEHFVFWPAMRNTREGAALARQFAVQRYPHFQVLARVDGELALLGAVSGIMSPDTLLGSLLQILDEKKSFIDAMKAKNERQELDRSLMASQNDEFEAALEEDRAREEEERMAIEESKRLKQEEEEREAEEKREKERQLEEKQKRILEEKQAKRERLPEEPVKGEGLQALISIRTVGGKKLNRRFLAHNTIQTLYDFVDLEVEGIEPDTYTLFSNFPRREYDDLQMTLDIAGLCPNSVLEMRRK
uniref:UBX domain-containing protein n=1 Tax=Paramoeba aestuarina TaxID=180227 RepID=A0A7S4KIN4_9EUKA|mmetsp:Transcript_19873/g.31156  ORF Transcript_19873/g.31156 Transcript_19873/m.31156 type:complete len:342 (+) Transcript_19873:281-1306(+)|eukprot:CAMPEP_0201527868 /NCGR_PEP_ID=MMETSP0161_2-20130828/36618_1 /ASSEMBLY_ACC=CAM_ASM_000251 /TAXON_ID=180227 /ORGANISM="Neoparamoeba aestuarina, Strain SoJaBio B1-5/56/2" /LENGTH=341 /DNA_ID=CAMNT_0047928891 /DNA_START=267 /DNA_END=1292 /DNA_ORIENTATION=+